jgi:hypothetical protein
MAPAARPVTRRQSRCPSIPTPRRSRRSLIRAYCTSTYQSQRRSRRSSKRSRSKKAKANEALSTQSCCAPVRVRPAHRSAAPSDCCACAASGHACRAAEQGDELAAAAHSITSLRARAAYPSTVSGVEIQLELGRCLHRQIVRLLAVKDALHI